MAKNINHLQHVKSNVVENGAPKLPNPSVLVEGELAVNYAADKETISLKNSSGVVVTFSSDNYYSEKKLGSGFTGENSGVTVTDVVNGFLRGVKVNGELLEPDSAMTVDVEVYKSLRFMGTTPSGHTLADPTDDYYLGELNDEEVGAWLISYSDGNMIIAPSGDSDAAGRIKLSTPNGWKEQLNYGGMTWANVGDILLVYRLSEYLGAYKIISMNEAGETRIGLMSPNDKTQVNKIPNIEIELGRKLPYSTDSTNIGNAGNGAYTNVSAGRTNWINTTSNGAGIKLGDLQIAVDPDGRLYSRNQSAKNGTWNITNQLETIGGTDLDTVYKPSVVGYGVCQNGPEESSGNPLTVYSFTSADLDGNGFRSILQVAIDRTNSTPYIRTTFYKPADSSFSKTNWVKIPDVSEFATRQWVEEEKLGSGFTGENSGYTVTEAINDTELVMAAALNDLNQRKMDISAYTPVEMEYYHENGDSYLGAITVETDEVSTFDGVTPQGNVTLQVSGSSGNLGIVNVGPGQVIVGAVNNGQGDATIASDGTVGLGRINGNSTDRVVLVDESGAKMLATNTESGITSTLLVAESGVSVTTESGNIFTYNGVEVATVNDIPELEFDERPTSGSSNAVSSSGLYETFKEVEIVTSMALNDLDERKLDESAYTPTDLSGYYTSDEVDTLLDGKANSTHQHAISDVTNLQTTLNQKVSAVTLNNSTKTPTNGVVNLGTVISSLTLNSSAQTVTNGNVSLTLTANYDGNAKKLYLKNGNAVLSEIDATDFIKDGMVEDVKVDEVTSGENSGSTCLIITFNTDAGKEDIEIPLSDMFDSDLFYTKEEVNTMLGSGFTEDIDEPGFKSVEDTIYDMSVVTSAALNDLNQRKMDVSAYTPVELEYYHENETVSGMPISAGTFVTNENGNMLLNAITNGGNEDIVIIGASNPQEVKDSSVIVRPGVMQLSSISNSDGDSSFALSGGSIQAYGDSVEVGAMDRTILRTGLDQDSNFTSLVADRTAISLSAFTYDQLGYEVTQQLNVDIDSGVSVSATSFTYNGKEVATVDDIYTKQEIDAAFGSGFTVSAITSSVTDVIKENEVIIAAALNDLETKKLDASAYTPTDLSDYATKQWVNEERLGSGFTGENSGNTVTSELDEMALVTSEAINDLNDRISGNTTFINQVNAKADNIARSLSGYTPSGYSYSKGEVEVKLSDKLDASAYTPTDLSNYYTKTEVDDKLGSGFTGENSGLTVTKAMNDTERAVAAALNDLNSRIIDLEDDKQDVLVSGVNIKTINNESILGTGNIVIQGGGGGGTGDLSGVTFNGVPATKSNGVAAITANVVSSVTMNNASKTITNGALNLGTVITAETPLSTASTGTGSVVTGLTVSNHQITMQKGSLTLDNVSDGTSRKLPTSLSDITSAHTHTEYASTAHTADTTIHVTANEKDAWNGKQNAFSNSSVLSGITAQQVTNWDNAATSAHSHSNKSVLDGINATKVTNWDGAATNSHNHDNLAVLDSLSASVITNSHTHSNKTALDNLTQTVIDNSHGHTNKSVLDGITTAKTSQWDNAISGVSLNGTAATVTNHVAALTGVATTTALNTHTGDTTAHVTAANKTQWNNAISGVSLNGSAATVTNHVAALTDVATTTALNTHTGNTTVHLPAVTAADNGKILMVVNGQWALVNPTTIYTGTGTPSSSQGNDGDIYLQTS